MRHDSEVSTMSYSHTQMVPTGLLTGLGVAGTLAALTAPGRVMKVVMTPLMLGLVGTFRSLSVSIDEQEIAVKFGNWFTAKRIPLTRVKSCNPVRMSPLHGWGIHFVGNGWLYNIYGLDAVEIDLVDGSKAFIGTDEPANLCDAIEAALG